MMMQEISDPPKIKTLSFPIKKSFELFRNACNVTLDFENTYFENKIEQIKNCREEFQSIVNDTIQQSVELAKFGEDLMVIIERCGDKTAPNEEKINYLNRLLNGAIINKTAIEKTNSKIKTLEDEMTIIHNELVNFDFENMKNIDSTTCNNLNDIEYKKKLLNEMAEIGFIISGICLIVAMPVAGIPRAASLVAKVAVVGAAKLAATAGVAKVAGVAGATGAAVVGTTTLCIAKNKQEEAFRLHETLSTRQGQMTKKSKILQKNVYSISQSLNDIKNFWSIQIAELENLIVEFKSLKEQRSYNILTIDRLERRWKKTIEECEEYSNIIGKELDDDMNNKK